MNRGLSRPAAGDLERDRRIRVAGTWPTVRVFLHLPPIDGSKRRGEGEFWRSFRADYPAILGGLSSAVVGGLRDLASVQMAELPRMADFACFGEAVAAVSGGQPMHSPRSIARTGATTR